MAAPVPKQVLDCFSDQRWRLSNLYWITDKEGKRVKFEPNWAQLELLDEIHYLNLVLKARQLGFCLDPTTRVLTADLHWVPIGEIKPGTEVVSVDEFPENKGKGQTRKMRTATVVASGRVFRDAYRITVDDGRSVVCTGQHPWLTKKSNPQAEWRKIDGGKERLQVGTYIRWITKPWEDPTVEDGWFGGMLDGEGSMAKDCHVASINVSQREGPVWDRLNRYVEDRGYNHCIEGDKPERPSKFGKVPVPKISIGRMDEMFRVIGQTRPTRFIGRRFWETRELPGKRSGVGWAKVVSIEKLPNQEMVDLQTTTGTYIAEGFVSHNTTFIQLYLLDMTVFYPDTRCGVIAQTMDDASAIFRDKIKFPYDNLPDQIKSVSAPKRDNTTMLELTNNSIIRVGTSLRSGTLQFLHVSEFGKICAKFPERAREIVTGALNTIQAGQMAFIESTAEGQEGRFYEMCQEAQTDKRMGSKLTELDWKFHFFPWWKESAYEIDPGGVTIAPSLAKYFTALEGLIGQPLNARKRAWYAKKLVSQKGDMKREYPSTPEEAFEASIEGAYYADELATAEQDGRIAMFPAHPEYKVHTAWDIGRRDHTAIWFFQVGKTSVRVVGFYQASGEVAAHFVKKVKTMCADNGWTHGTAWLPHDAKVIEWTSEGLQRIETILKSFKAKLVPDHGVADGINAVREAFRLFQFDETLCADGLRCLRNYRKEWDTEHGRWKDNPLHNWASDGADAMRYLAMCLKLEKDEPQNASKPPVGITGMTFDQLMERQVSPHAERA